MIQRTRDILSDLIAFPTISSDTNLPLIDYVEDILMKAGARCERQYDATGLKANLWATLGPDGDGGMVLSGHTDVVPVADQPWTTDPFEMVERDGRLFGRGTCDMKGFLACTIAMAEHFAAVRKPVHFAMTYDEEVSCFGAIELARMLKDRGIRPAMALIGEPTDMQVIEGHKGCYEYLTRVTGVEGHGSRPELGVNAGVYATRYVTRLMELAADQQADARPETGFEPPWTSVNVGKIVAGNATNVIPGMAEIAWEMRPMRDEDARTILSGLSQFVAETLEPEMQRNAPDTGFELVTVGEFPAFLATDPNPARDLLLSLTGANEAGLVSYCTEAGAFADLGLSAVICGPGSILQAHKPDEYVEIAQLEACLALQGKLAQRLT